MLSSLVFKKPPFWIYSYPTYHSVPLPVSFACDYLSPGLFHTGVLSVWIFGPVQSLHSHTPWPHSSSYTESQLYAETPKFRSLACIIFLSSRKSSAHMIISGLSIDIKIQTPPPTSSPTTCTFICFLANFLISVTRNSIFLVAQTKKSWHKSWLLSVSQYPHSIHQQILQFYLQNISRIPSFFLPLLYHPSPKYHHVFSWIISLAFLAGIFAYALFLS